LGNPVYWFLGNVPWLPRSFIRYFTDKMTGREREKGIGTKIRVKMAAKMLVIAWTLMKKKEMFRAEHIS